MARLANVAGFDVAEMLARRGRTVMTRGAGMRRTAKPAASVAGLAANTDMPARQREACLEMVELALRRYLR